MEKYFRILNYLFISCLFAACIENSVEPPLAPENNLSEFEKSMTGTWQYLRIIAAGDEFVYADLNTEPGKVLTSSALGKRAELERRRINYSKDKTYQLRWVDRGNYELGTDGDPNWQPNYGFWYHDLATDSVYHNYGLHYQIGYKITINGNVMERRSIRYMSSDFTDGFGRIWEKGEKVEFVEQFYKL